MLKSVVSVAVFAAAAMAQSSGLAFTSFPPTTVAAGSPVTLTWIGGDSSAPVTITLKKGLSTDLKDVGVITSKHFYYHSAPARSLTVQRHCYRWIIHLDTRYHHQQWR